MYQHTSKHAVERLPQTGTLWTLAMELAPRLLEIGRLHREANAAEYPRCQDLRDQAEGIAEGHWDAMERVDLLSSAANVFPWDVLDAAKVAHMAA